MIGKRAQAIISIEEGDAVMLGTAPAKKRTVDLWAFSPEEARLVARHLLQAADVCEGKPQPYGGVVFLADGMEVRTSEGKVPREDFERDVCEELERYCVGDPTDERTAFSDGAEWALAHYAQGVDHNIPAEKAS